MSFKLRLSTLRPASCTRDPYQTPRSVLKINQVSIRKKYDKVRLVLGSRLSKRP